MLLSVNNFGMPACLPSNAMNICLSLITQLMSETDKGRKWKVEVPRM